MQPATPMAKLPRNAPSMQLASSGTYVQVGYVRSLQKQLGLHRNGIFTEVCSHDDDKLFHATDKLLCALSHALEVLFYASPAHPT